MNERALEDALLALVGAWAEAQAGRPDAPDSFPQPILDLATPQLVQSLLRRRLSYLSRIGLLLLLVQLHPPYAVLLQTYREGIEAGDVSAIKHDIRILGPHLPKEDVDATTDALALGDVVKEQVRVDEGVMRFAAVDTGFDRTPRGLRVVVDLATLDVEVEELEPTVR